MLFRSAKSLNSKSAYSTPGKQGKLDTHIIVVWVDNEAGVLARVVGLFFIGIYGGFLQAGVGIVIMLLLTQVSRLSLIRTNSIKAFSVFFYSIAAVAIFALDGKIIWMVGLWMVLGSIAGAWLSSRWSVDKGDKVIRITLLIMVTYMAIKLWLETFNT